MYLGILEQELKEQTLPNWGYCCNWRKRAGLQEDSEEVVRCEDEVCGISRLSHTMLVQTLLSVSNTHLNALERKFIVSPQQLSKAEISPNLLMSSTSLIMKL